MSIGRCTALLVLGALVGLTGCGGGGRKGPGGTAPTSTSSSVAAALPTTATAPGASPTTIGGKDPDVRDWDGARFDIGRLDRIDRTEDGRTLVVFDRMQLTGEHGARSGQDFTSEPILVGNTDNPLVNDTTKLRTYVARPGVEVLRVANLRDTCTDRPDPAQPRWEPVTVDRVVDESLEKDYQEVSLTFTAEGQVSRIRLSSGC